MSQSSASLDALKIDRRDRRQSRGCLYTAVVLVLVLGGLAAYGWYRRQAGVPVQLYTVTSAESDGGRIALNASGYVVARRAATVSSKITGKVVEVLVEEGMEVQKGQVLARLDDTNVRAALELAAAELEAARAALAETEATRAQAERELARVQALTRTAIASESELDAAEAEVLALQARLQRQTALIEVAERYLAVRRQEVEDTVVRAPFSGMATAKNAQPGEMISPISAGGGFTRTGIGTIVDMGSLEIEVEVNESYLQRVRAEQRVEAVLDAYPDWKVPGRVIAVIPTADRQKATVKVRVGFDELDPRLLPEMGVKVAFLASATESDASEVVVVLRAALHKDEGRDVVWVVVEGRVEYRPVQLGVLRTDDAVVTEGLRAGERVVLSAPRELADGARVHEEQP